MGSLLDKITQSLGSEPTSSEKQSKQNTKSNQLLKTSNKILDEAAEDSLVEGGKNLFRKLAQAVEKGVPVTPWETERSREIFNRNLQADIRYGELANQANIKQNPISGNTQMFLTESLPYLLAGGMYKRGIDAALPRFSDTVLGRSLATARGSAPTTGMVDIAQNRMPTEGEFWQNQAFDLGLSPIGGVLTKNYKPQQGSSRTPEPEPTPDNLVMTPDEIKTQGLDPEDFPDSGSKIEPESKRIILDTKDNMNVTDLLDDDVVVPLNTILKQELPILKDVQVSMRKQEDLAEPYEVFKDGDKIEIIYKDKIDPEMKAEINQAVLQHETQHITRPGTSPEQIKAASEHYDIKQVDEYGKKFDEEIAPYLAEDGHTAKEIAEAKVDIVNESIYRNQKGEMLARENERIETGNAPLANKDVNPYVAHLSNVMKEINPTGEVLTGKRKEPTRMNQVVTPAKEVDAKTIDMVNKNNYDTAVLKSDVENILRDLQIPNKKSVMKEIESALAKSTNKIIKLPKTKLGRKVYSELMKIDKYRLQDQFIMPKKLADKINKGHSLNASDRRYLKKNEKYLSESERKSLETYTDIDALLSAKTPFDEVINLMNKYETDSIEFPAMTKEVIAEYKKNPKFFRQMRAEVVSSIKNDLRTGRVKEDAPSVSGKTVDADNKPDVKQNADLESAESGALSKAKREKAKRTKDTSSMNREEKAMHEKGQKDYIFKNKDKPSKREQLEKEKIEIEQAQAKEPYRNDAKDVEVDADGFVIFDKADKDSWIETKRGDSKKSFDKTREQMSGEVGKESTKFVKGAKNPAKKADKESTEIFTDPQAMHTEFNEGSGHTGYEGGNQTYLKTLINGSTAFETYIHESFHKILDRKDFEKLIEAFNKNYDAGNTPHYDEANMKKNYFDKNPLQQFEENIVFAASDLMMSKLPVEVLDRLEIDLTKHNARLKNLDNLTPEMKQIVDDLVEKAETAINSKNNYLNDFAYGNKERIMTTLDRYGEAIIESVIDSLIPMMKKIDQKGTDFKSYRKAREYADELIANIVSQANKLPAQKFIDKFTSIARATEERGKNFGNQTAGEIKTAFKDKKVREQLTNVVMRKDVQSIADEVHGSSTYDDFLKARKANEKEIRLFLSNGVKKQVKQLIASFTDPKAMNSPHWKHNAYEILMTSKPFKKMLNEYHRTHDPKLKQQLSDITHALDKHISMEAITLNDFNFMKGLDQEAFKKVVNMHKEAVIESKNAMATPSSTYIKGYKPSLFKNYIEFKDKSQLSPVKDYVYREKDADGRRERDGSKIKMLDGWKRYKNTDLYYREAIKPDAASGIMTQREHNAKGTVTDIKHEHANIEAYAQQHGYGLITIDGEKKLRRVVSQDVRREILDENMDFAENMGSLVENNVHDKVTGKHDAEMLDQLNKNRLIVDEFDATNDFVQMIPKELNLMPDRIKKALIDTYGIDNIYISKKYKEQLIGYSKDISVIKHLTKSDIQVTHKMLMTEAKILDGITETTQLIKQTLILKNPVVITGNYVFQSIVAVLEGVPVKDVAKYHKEAHADFKKYTELMEKKISLEINGKKDSVEWKKNQQKLEGNVAHRLFRENMDGGGIDRNLLLKSLRESNLSRKPMEKYVTEKLGGEDAKAYKAASFAFVTPESYVGNFFVKSLNYVDYMGRSTLMRHYMQQGKSFEDAARLANSKTVSFSKQLPSSTAWIERYGMDHFLTWTLRNSVGLGVSMKEHPARWLAFAVAYEALTEKEGKYDTSYIGDLRVSSFNPAESILTNMLDSGIYGHIAQDGAFAFEPEVVRKIREGKNPIVTTK